MTIVLPEGSKRFLPILVRFENGRDEPLDDVIADARKWRNMDPHYTVGERLKEAEKRVGQLRYCLIVTFHRAYPDDPWRRCTACGGEWRVRGGDEVHTEDCPARPL